MSYISAVKRVRELRYLAKNPNTDVLFNSRFMKITVFILLTFYIVPFSTHRNVLTGRMKQGSV